MSEKKYPEHAERVAEHKAMLDEHAAAWAITVMKDPTLLDNPWVNWPEDEHGCR